MGMKTERLQVLIETEQRERLGRIAAQRGVSVASLVRRAIDVAYPSSLEPKAAIVAGILAAGPMDVPDPHHLRAELELIHGYAR